MTDSTKAVYITLGLPASGKTYFTERLADELGLHHINTDKLRLSMIKSPEFSPEENDRVYQEMMRVTKAELANGATVICNGNYNQRTRRQAMSETAAELGVPCVVILVETPLEVVRERIVNRDHEIPTEKMVHQPLELLERMRKAYEPPTTNELVIHIDGTLPYKDQVASFHDQRRALEI